MVPRSGVCLLVLTASLLLAHGQAQGSGDLCNGRRDGSYPNPSSCSEFVTCNNGNQAIQKCPPGLYFNGPLLICDFAYNVVCGQEAAPVPEESFPGNQGFQTVQHPPPPPPPRVEVPPPPPSPPHQPVHASFSDDNGGRMVDTVHSDFPDPSQVRLVLPPVSTANVDASKSCSVDGYFADPTDCSHFILCVQGARYRNMCSPGTYFDPRTNMCGFDQAACHRFNPVPHQSSSRPVPHQSSAQPVPHQSSAQPVPQYTRPPHRTPSKPHSTFSSRPPHFTRRPSVFDFAQMASAIKDALVSAKDTITQLMRTEANRARFMPQLRGAFSGVTSFLGSTPYVKQLSIPAAQQLAAIKDVMNRFDISKDDIFTRASSYDTMLTPSTVLVAPDMPNPHPTMGVCPYAVNSEQNLCDSSKPYRTYDGTCNNLQRPLWGKSFRPLFRFLSPDYADGVGAPRISVTGNPLPSARAVTLSLFEDRDRPSHVHTIMLMTFGQFIDHDITRTAITKLNSDAGGDGQMIDVMCGSSGCETQGAENRACLPIYVPSNDPDFRNKTCLMFVRSQEVLRDNCELGPREQLNQITSYLDASMIYGSTKEEADKLRDYDDRDRGRMVIRPNPDRQYHGMLPPTVDEECREVNSEIQCFLAGDERVNEQIGLGALHHAFHRYHNVIEARLRALNGHWAGEKLFQETRRIITALWQHMTYKEWLPLALGPQKMRQFGLELSSNGYYDAYDPSVNVEASNAFATAAFRFAHTLIQGDVEFASQNYDKVQKQFLSKVLRRPFELYNNGRPGGSGVDSILLGQISQPAQSYDTFFTREISSRLFSENPPHAPGLDLPALNIQRGRDHGIPGYNHWRQWCGLPKANSFDDLDISYETRANFKRVYEHVDDIDLFPGGIAERAVPGGTTGPTFACIIGRQFRKARVGDRFWYERSDPTVAFTPDQLQEIRKITVARVLCDTMDHMEKIQKYVMLQPLSKVFQTLGSQNYQDAYSLASLYRGDDNERRSCKDIPDIDLTKWVE